MRYGFITNKTNKIFLCIARTEKNWNEDQNKIWYWKRDKR